MLSTAGALGVVDRLHLPGPIEKSDISAYLNQGDIFLNTTDVDNTPVTVLEALACGLCVVSTDVGGLPYLLRTEHDALLVRPRDPAEMARAVRRVLTEPGLARRLSTSGRRKVEGMDWKNVIPGWNRLLSSVAAGSSLGPQSKAAISVSATGRS
jgi:glycosyltransferase involved in cell wall biosynthesis